ncbi:two-component system response regulator [Roseateles sp.]|uniref:response regulator n=1 Tax=Roseateles sp. TaxID=1971397 RepID=UPI0025D074D7|nr:two-component system response regulator [Roseateles sp.]MBV8036135.1 two-component system response regulator [Roseateles sp.]
MITTDDRPRLLVVDDEPTNLQVLRHVLQADYRLLFATDGERAIALARQQRPDLILLDVMMPGMNGHEVCRTLKADSATASTPIIFVTALSDSQDEAHGLDVGAVDYITKPVSAPVVRARVRNHLTLVRLDELRETRLQIVQRLGRAAEYKDNETGLHVIRMSHFSRRLALAAGFNEAWADDLLNAAPMHDVGKIGIPDAVLRKPGPLDEAEWAIMRRHPEIGAEIIGEHPSGLLRMARTIALAHHEKWDGSGYPRNLEGEQIPVEARIVAIADVFDALTTRRPYKSAWPVEQALEHIQAQAGRHFDPALVEKFIGLVPDLLEIQRRWADEPEVAHAVSEAP